MPNKKLTNAEILNGLEHCKNDGDCFPCPLSGTAYCIHSTTTAKVYYDFIIRRDAEIDSLVNMYFRFVDTFRDRLADKYLSLCNYNDFNKLNLEKIVDTLNGIYDNLVKEMTDERS